MKLTTQYPYLVLLTGLLLLGGGTLRAQQENVLVFDSNDLFYNVIDYRIPGVEVTYPNLLQSELWKGYDLPRGAIQFPSTIVYRGVKYQVMEIAPWTFSGCTGITSVALTDQLNMIGFSAFASCSGLKSIEVPSSVKTLGGCAFFACVNLSSVTLPASLVCIEPYTFAECISLGDIDLPGDLEFIGNNAFEACGLRSIAIPASVKVIEAKAFNNCKALTSVHVMAKYPPQLGQDAFAKLPSEAVLYVPKGCVEAYRNAEGWNLFSVMQEEE